MKKSYCLVFTLSSCMVLGCNTISVKYINDKQHFKVNFI